MSQTDFHYQKKDLPAGLSKIGLILFVVGTALSLLAFFVDQERAVFNYLVTYMIRRFEKDIQQHIPLNELPHGTFRSILQPKELVAN